MAKYIALRSKEIRGDGWEADELWYDDYPAPNVPSVDDSALLPTGLVDGRGIPLYRVPNPIGFGRKLEW